MQRYAFLHYCHLGQSLVTWPIIIGFHLGQSLVTWPIISNLQLIYSIRTMFGPNPSAEGT